jgi:hypothetical protein
VVTRHHTLIALAVLAAPLALAGALGWRSLDHLRHIRPASPIPPPSLGCDSPRRPNGSSARGHRFDIPKLTGLADAVVKHPAGAPMTGTPLVVLSIIAVPPR